MRASGPASRAQRRRLLERGMARLGAQPCSDFAPPLQPVADGIFALERRLRLPGGALLDTRSAIVRLPDGGLVVFAPPRLDVATQHALAALGPVRALVAPNSFHYLGFAEAAAAWPAAQRFLAPGLAERRPELPRGAVLGDASPELWRGTLAQAVYGPCAGVAEAVFFHPATATLLVTDLVFNVCEAANLRARLFWRAAGAWRRFGPSRTVRALLLRDRVALAAFLRGVLTWPFERVVMAHGAILPGGGRAALAAAFAPLVAEPLLLEPPAATPEK